MAAGKTIKRFFIILALLVVVGFLAFGYIRYYVPFSDSGVKAGVLNNVKHKGMIFKTYEGELIQTGFRAGDQGLQSNDFQFSVDDEELGKKLMSLGGQQVKLHYKEYYARLPWRGHSAYVVDSIMEALPIPEQNMESSSPPIFQ